MNQRPIKLRAWDSEQRTFVPLLTLSEEDTHTIVQFTGKYDYNGREIGEGDIVKWAYFYEEESRYMEYYYVIVFQDGCFGSKDDSGEFTPFMEMGKGDVVVGTVFTDAYLLTQNLQLDWR